ncbi:hypothetical protein JTB14_031877 [Gonioctena quinquepunctata]|nr:hypothetical protein JTB14_031877 [Gonioctena quinquepunctata]
MQKRFSTNQASWISPSPPPCLYPEIIIENSVKKQAASGVCKKLMIANEREKPPSKVYSEIKQVDGPTDTSDVYTSRSEDENEQDFSMRKKNIQTKRNVKRRKTSRTNEEIEFDQEDRKANFERTEKEKRKLAVKKIYENQKKLSQTQ